MLIKRAAKRVHPGDPKFIGLEKELLIDFSDGKRRIIELTVIIHDPGEVKKLDSNDAFGVNFDLTPEESRLLCEKIDEWRIEHGIRSEFWEKREKALEKQLKTLRETLERGYRSEKSRLYDAYSSKIKEHYEKYRTAIIEATLSNTRSQATEAFGEDTRKEPEVRITTSEELDKKLEELFSISHCFLCKKTECECSKGNLDVPA